MNTSEKLIAAIAKSGSLLLFAILLLAFSSCAHNPSNIGRIVSNNQALSATSANEVDETWKSKDMEVVYRTTQVDNSFIISGELSINDSITRTFPHFLWLKFYINYLDSGNRIIATEKIAVKTGYKNKKAKNLKFIDVPPAPAGAESFAFSYWGVLVGKGISDENPGEWEIYFQPFENPTTEIQSEGNGIFYKQ